MNQNSTSRVIMHLDMDAFFAAVEVLDNPDLAGQCLVVGGHSKRGVVAAASYEARRHGIYSAMPMFQAKKRCEDLVVVPPRRSRYRDISGQVMAIIHSVSPQVEPVSIDEAYADITGCERLHGPPKALAQHLKNHIYNTVGLTCSIGIAPNRFLAKIASDMDKPNGLMIIEPGEVMGFIKGLPIKKVPGVGKHAFDVLKKMGVNTLGDIGRYTETSLTKRLGKFGFRLVELSKGEDHVPVTSQTASKSISSEETLATDTKDKEILKTHLMRQAEDVGRQLRRKKMRARTVTLKIKHSDFKQISRSRTMRRSIQSTEFIYRRAVRLLDRYSLTKPVRLIGLGVSSLASSPAPVQMGLFDEARDGNTAWEEVDQTVDAITAKFGQGSIQKARLTKKDP